MGGTTYSSVVLANSPLAFYRLGEASFATVSTATSSTNFGSEPPGNAFDGSSTTYWTTNAVSSGWLRAQLNTAAISTSYSITRRDDIPNRNPNSWTFEGSNDGSSWTTLDTRSGITWSTTGEVKTFTFSNTTAYLYYRLNVSANNGDTYLSVAELYVGIADAIDSSGNSHNGRYQGTISLAQTGGLSGDSDTCALFTGTNGQYIPVVPFASWMEPTDFTIEAMIKPTALNVTQTIASRYNAAFASSAWSFRIDTDGVLRMYLFTGSSFNSVAATFTFSTGTWYHVAATVSGTSVTLYVNGMSVGTGTSSRNTSTSSPLVIGARYTDGSSFGLEPWKGYLDEVAIYGSALSAGTLANHYVQSNLYSKNSYDTAVLADSPLAYLPLDESAGTVARDLSGNDHPGTYNGGTKNQTKVMPLGAASFLSNASSEYVKIPLASWMNQASFTVECWVKFTNLSSYHNVFNRDGATARGWNLYSNGTEMDGFDGISDISTTGAGLATSTPYLLAITCDGSTLKLYKNGVLQRSTTATNGWTTNASGTSSANDLMIGCSYAGTGTPQLSTNGTLENYAYYGSVLTASQLLAHYTASQSTAATGSGSLTLGASWAVPLPASGAGSLTLGASWAVPLPAAGSGSLTLGGSGAANAPAAGSGSLTLSGSGSTTSPAAGSGSLSLSASGSWTLTPSSGSLTLAATGSTAAPVTGSASLSLSGTGDTAGPATGSGSLSLSGSGTTQAVAAGSGSLTLTFSPTVTSVSSGAASGSLTLSASGSTASLASGSGSVSLSATGAAALGSTSTSGTASLDLAATGTANIADTTHMLVFSEQVGYGWFDRDLDPVTIFDADLLSVPPTAPLPSGSGSLSLSASGTASLPTTGTASLSLSATGNTAASTTASGSLSLSASGTTTSPASASGSLTLSGSATAPAIPVTGSGSLTLSATGSTTSPVTATGSLTLTGSGSTSSPIAGSGSITLTGSGTLPQPITSSGSLTLTASGTTTVPVTGTGAITLAGSGTAASTLSGTGSITLSASGVTAVPVTGSGSLSLSATGAATSGVPTSGSGSLDLAANFDTLHGSSAALALTAVGTVLPALRVISGSIASRTVGVGSNYRVATFVGARKGG